MMGGKKEIITPFMDRVENKLLETAFDKETPNKCLDNYAHLTFLKGVCLRHLGYTLQSMECFEDVLGCKKRLEFEQQLLPQSCFELGSLHRKLGQLSEAKKWFKRARDDYTGYLTEIMIQYRSGHMLKCIKNEMKEAHAKD